MAEKKEISLNSKKNVSLIGFDELDESEQEIMKKLIANYIKKIEDRINYDELKIKLKIHQKGKMFMHEVIGDLYVTKGMALNAGFAHKNPYKAIAQVMNKLINSITHKKRDKK